jgi:N-acetylglutamate synthase-like GNAT family acetyltransferase
MEIKLIEYNSIDYDKMISLRINVLLAPIGVPSSFIHRANEVNDLLVGAFQEADLIGCCVLTKVNDTTIQLRQMAVDTLTQGTGVGAAIIEYAEAVAKDKGYSKLLLNARDTVIPFYEKCGYHITGDGFTEVNIPHHTMVKDISN